MQTRLKLKPGQKGTKKLVQEYGDNLVCVRYRYDEKSQKRFKTIELIIEEIPWNPKEAQKVGKMNEITEVSIGYNERELRNLVKKAGGVWNNQKKAWELEYRKIIELNLEDRIAK